MLIHPDTAHELHRVRHGELLAQAAQYRLATEATAGECHWLRTATSSLLGAVRRRTAGGAHGQPIAEQPVAEGRLAWPE